MQANYEIFIFFYIGLNINLNLINFSELKQNFNYLDLKLSRTKCMPI